MFKHPSVLYVERNPLHIQSIQHLTKEQYNQIYGLVAFLLSYSIKKISADTKTRVF